VASSFKSLFQPTSESDFWGKDHQVGEGTATKPGKFRFDSKFCFHVVLDGNINFAESQLKPLKSGQAEASIQNVVRYFSNDNPASHRTRAYGYFVWTG
jgi:hypothetical protein